jgi:hypothetical protein
MDTSLRVVLGALLQLVVILVVMGALLGNRRATRRRYLRQTRKPKLCVKRLTARRCTKKVREPIVQILPKGE